MPSEHGDANLIGSTEASRLLDIHPVTLTRWVAKGKLAPAGRLSDGGAFVFHRSDVEALLATDSSPCNGTCA